MDISVVWGLVPWRNWLELIGETTMDPLLIALCSNQSADQEDLFAQLLQKSGTDNWVLLQVAAHVPNLRKRVIMNHLGLITDESERVRALGFCETQEERNHVNDLWHKARPHVVRRAIAV